MASEPRYQRTRETMMALRQLLNGEAVAMQGEFLNLEIDPPMRAPSVAIVRYFILVVCQNRPEMWRRNAQMYF